MRKTLLFPLVLCACGGIPLKSMVELSRLDPMTANPAGIAVAVDVSEGLRAAPGKTKLTLSAEGAGGKSLEEVFVLRQTLDSASDVDRVIFALNTPDIDRMNATRRTIAGWKNEDPDTRGSISINAEPCLVRPTDTESPLIFAVSMRIADDRPFVPVVSEADLRDEMPNGLEIPACDT